MIRVIAFVLYVVGLLFGERSRRREERATKPPPPRPRAEGRPDWQTQLQRARDRARAEGRDPADLLTSAIRLSAAATRCEPELERERFDVPIVFDVDATKGRAVLGPLSRPFRVAKLAIVEVTDGGNRERLLTFDDGVLLSSFYVGPAEQLHGPIPASVLNEGAIMGAPWLMPGQTLAIELQRTEREVLPLQRCVVQLRGIAPRVASPAPSSSCAPPTPSSSPPDSSPDSARDSSPPSSSPATGERW